MAASDQPHPIGKKDPRVLSLVAHLRRQTGRDGVLRDHPLAQRWLADRFGGGQDPRKFRAAPLLAAVVETLRALGCRAELAGHDASPRYRAGRFQGQARTISVEWSPAALAAASPPTRAARRAASLKKRALELAAEVGRDSLASDATRRIVEYHNGLSTNKTSKLRHDLAALRPDDPRQRAIVDELLARPHMLLRTSPHTCRAVADGVSVLSLKRELRARLGLLEFDLQSAYLAIAATRFGCRRLREALEVGVDVPAFLASEIGVPGARSACKLALNGLIHGQTVPNCRDGHDDDEGEHQPGLRDRLAELAENEGAERAAAAFFAHPLVRELVRAVRGQLRELRREGGAERVDGRFVSIDEVVDGRKAGGARLRSMLAYLLSDVEACLMSAVYEVAAARPDDFTILAYLNDGAAVRIHRGGERRAQVVRAILKAVDDRARRLGIATRLVLKAAPAPTPAPAPARLSRPTLPTLPMLPALSATVSFAPAPAAEQRPPEQRPREEPPAPGAVRWVHVSRFQSVPSTWRRRGDWVAVPIGRKKKKSSPGENARRLLAGGRA